MGRGGGGICGSRAGHSNGHITITHSHSTGTILGESSGGICGGNAGYTGGHVSVSHSYFTGTIDCSRSGGICGKSSGESNEEVVIEQCYSVGKINGSRSGGITGSNTAERNGHVSITNCYSLGDIKGSNHAGGICGASAGSTSRKRDGGTVIVTNVYASGQSQDEDTGGIIGEVDGEANQINITMSVYDGCNNTTSMIGGTKGAHVDERNSNISDIIGTLCCFVGDGDQPGEKECWNNATI